MNHEIILESELEVDTATYEALLNRVIPEALETEGVTIPCEVDVLFTDDAGIQEINREQRQMDKPTDVLSFPAFDLIPGTPPTKPEESGLFPLGDMVISLERAEEQAKEFGHSTQREVAYLTVHSILHLLGYDHLDEGPQKAQMRAREEAILKNLGITRGETI